MAGSALDKSAENKNVGEGKSFNQSMPTTPYILVLLDSAKDLPRGTEKTIEAPYLSLGRDTDCTICYGDDFPMVSRLHAAIEWSEDSYTLRHLSNTNQTLLNDRPIARKWFLHDDDVIQLAPSGPRIKFKMPLILHTQPAKGTLNSLKIKGGNKKEMVDNVAMIAVIALAVLLTILMVYLTLS
jgi:pSer/pThr/pTyr-binding forkhead associated (FHA) protein